MGKRIIILGSSGFFGQHLLPFLSKKHPEYEVVGFSSKDIDLTREESRIQLKKHFTPESIVIMCAGIKSNYGNSLETYRKNVLMAENVGAVLVEHPVQKFLFFSSNAVYGVDIDDSAISESTPVILDTYYGLSKFVSEQILNLATESPLVHIRTPTIYGPGEKIKASTPSGFLTRYMDGEEVTLWGDGSELREFIFVGDLLRIVDALAFDSFTGPINTCSGEGHSYRETLDIIGKLLGRKLVVHSKERTKEKVDKVYNTALLKRTLPEFTFSSLEKGLQKIKDWDGRTYGDASEWNSLNSSGRGPGEIYH